MTIMTDLSEYDSEHLVQILLSEPVSSWNKYVRETHKKHPNWRAEIVGFDLQKVYKPKGEGLNLRQADLTDSKFRRADLKMVSLEEAILHNTDFVYADLGWAIFDNAQAQNANFREADLEEAEFLDANLRGANFEDSHLWGAKFEGANLDGAVFAGANLTGSNFNRTDTSMADMKEAYFEKDNDEIILTGSSQYLGDLKDKSLHVFGAETDSGYVLRHAGNVFRNSEEFKERISSKDPDMVGVAEMLIVELDKMSFGSPRLLDIGSPDRRADYLRAESKRTGQSPVDIILGDD